MPRDVNIGEGYEDGVMVTRAYPSQHIGQYQYWDHPNVVPREGMGMGAIVDVPQTMADWIGAEADQSWKHQDRSGPIMPVEHTMAGWRGSFAGLGGLWDDWVEVLGKSELDELGRQVRTLHDQIVAAYGLLDAIEKGGAVAQTNVGRVPEGSEAKTEFRKSLEASRMAYGQLVRFDFTINQVAASFRTHQDLLDRHGVGVSGLVKAVDLFNRTMKERVYDRFPGWKSQYNKMQSLALSTWAKKHPGKALQPADPEWLEIVVQAADAVLPVLSEKIVEEKVKGLANPLGPLAIIGIIVAGAISIMGVLYALKRLIESFNSTALALADAHQKFEDRLERERRLFIEKAVAEGASMDEAMARWKPIEQEMREKHKEEMDRLAETGATPLTDIMKWGGIAAAGLIGLLYVLPMLKG